MGALLIYMGYYDRGKEILDSAFQQVPDLIWWHVLAFSFHSFIRERYQDAIFWANRIEMSVEQIPLIKAASFAYLDEYDRGIEAFGYARIGQISRRPSDDTTSFKAIYA